MTTIAVKNHILEGLDYSSGTSLLVRIEAAFATEERVLLDFSGVDAITSALLNGSIGEWISKNDLAEFKAKFQFVNLTPTMWEIIKNYVTKQFEPQKA